MKKYILMLLLFAGNLVYCQTTPEVTDTITANSYAEAIDLTYGLLPQAHYEDGFLIDKAGWHYTLDYADGKQNDSIFNLYNWYLFYDKCFYSQLKQNLKYRFVQLDSLKNRYIEDNDILPFGVLNYSYYKLRDSAILGGAVIVNNHRLTENTINLSKIYVKSKLFCVSPLNTEVNTLNPQFTFLPELFLSDSSANLLKMFINFDDGLGYREVFKQQTFQASYAEAGYKNIVSKFIYANGDTLYSSSQLYCNDPNSIPGVSKATGIPGFYSAVFDFSFDVLTDPSIWPTSEFGITYKFKKATCGVWRGCGNEDGTNIRKPIIMFAGYNPKNGKELYDNNNAAWVNDYFGPLLSLAGWRGPLYETYNGFYTDASTGPQNYGDNTSHFLDKLRGEGYDIVIVKMHEGIGYLEHYAMMVSAVIREINIKKVNSTNLNPGAAKDPEAPGYPNSTALTKPHHENIVVGYSAGALAAKTGLLLMEYQHKKYKNTSDAYKYPHHNTKIWVGYDCENQGSNVPIGFQMMLDYMGNSGIAATNLGDIAHSVVANSALNLLKTNGIATQNTLYNIVNLSYCGGNVFCIDHHADFGLFIDNLSAISVNNPVNLKGYPQFVRRIGVSPGNANGLHNSLNESEMLFYESISNPCFSPSGGSFNVNPGINLNASAVQLRGHRKAQSYFMMQANTTQVALDCKIGLTIKTAFWSWYVNFPHWRYKNGNYINNAQNYDVRAASTLPTHVIYGRKLPFISDNTAAAAFTWCNVGKVNLTLHGFCPTTSALDIHEPWNTSLYRLPNEALTPINQNLLFQNDYNSSLELPSHHNFGYPHIKHPFNHYEITPFDAVCANGDYNSTYYQDNTIHVEDPNPYTAEFLTEELAPANLYLSNRTIHDETTGEKYYADFEARNSILVGNQEIYKHNHPTNKNLWYQRLQTSPGDFVIENNAVVTMRAGNDDQTSMVVLGAGFSAKSGCIFRAYTKQSYCTPYSPNGQRSASGNSQAPIQPQSRSMLAKRLTSAKLAVGVSQLNVSNYPNPTTGSIYYDVKEESYSYTISDISGRVLQTGELKPLQAVLNLSTFNSGIYLITIKNSSYTQTDRIILQ